jgi:endonuclease III
MRELAAHVNNDISPRLVSNLSIEVIEQIVKSLNHCHKKAKLLLQLAETFSNEPIPSTSAGLLKIHGMISFYIMQCNSLWL